MPNERVAGKLGRLAILPEGERLAIDYADAYVELTAPKSWPQDVSGGRTDWDMDGNDTYGDCGPAATNHETMVATGSVLWTAQQVIDEYLKYTGGEDVGVNLARWLLWCRGQGFIQGFAPLKLAQTDAWLNTTARGVMLGVSLTDEDMDAFSNGQPWSGTDPDPANGHAILKVIGEQNGDGTIVTWGALQKYTSAWFNACVEEAWVLVDEKDVGTTGYAALCAALNALPGATPVPDAPPPAPSPSPSPQPSPSPSPAPAPGAASFPGESVEVAAKVHQLALRKNLTDDAYLEWLLERLFHLNPQSSLSLRDVLDDDPYAALEL